VRKATSYFCDLGPHQLLECANLLHILVIFVLDKGRQTHIDNLSAKQSPLIPNLSAALLEDQAKRAVWLLVVAEIELMSFILLQKTLILD